MSMKIETDDIVRITMGRYRGSRGQVIKVFEGKASVQTSESVVVISLHALELAK